jgi:DNA repair photolyase
MPELPFVRGRGAAENPPNRFERLYIDPRDADPVGPDEEARELADARAWARGEAGDGEPDGSADGGADDFEPDDGPRDERGVVIPTEYYRDSSRTIIAHNDSPDIPFSSSINPYRGCEHGCIYCYARPYHEYLGFSAGLDFETKLFVKTDAPALLRAELMKPSWKPTTLALSGVTDCYQPIERKLKITRGCLEVLAEMRHPVGVITKNALVTRDIDVLAELAKVNAVRVSISVTSLDEQVRRVMEPRTSTAERRLDAIARLNAAGIPAGVNVAPIIPGLTDHEIPQILTRAAEAGARFAGYTMLRLPYAVAPLFEAWLARHFPDRQHKILERIRDIRGGKLNDPNFNTRMKGAGPFAEIVAEVFKKAKARAGIPARGPETSLEHFQRPRPQTPQLSLF